MQASWGVIQELQEQWQKKAAAIPIEDFMIPLLVGKKGAAVQGLEKETGATIVVDRIGSRMLVTGNDEDSVAAATDALNQRIQKMRSELWETKIDDKLFGSFIGKQGSNINKIRQESGALVEIDAKTLIVRVRGHTGALV